jgi:Family of unknown function (DUF6763)
MVSPSDETGELEIPEPEVGAWYRDHELRLFEVVALDVVEGSIGIQHFDGTVEELETQDWFALLPRIAEPPEDWSGAMDVSADDYLTEFDADTEPDRGNPLDRLDGIG